jgi:hypothetical protein
MAITFLGEIIPGFDAIPFLSFLWTIGIITTIAITRAEDGKGGIMSKAINVAQGAATGGIKGALRKIV